MEELNELTVLLNKISNVSNQIIKKSVDLMGDISNEGSEVIDDLLEVLTNNGEMTSALFRKRRGFDGTNKEKELPSREDALSHLQNESLSFVVDAEKVLNEIPLFIVKEAGTQRGWSINTEDKCPFLSEVWNGDAYDKTEIEGLKALLSDLQNQFEQITTENLVKIVIENCF